MTIEINLNQNIYDGSKEALETSITELEILKGIIQEGTEQLDGLANGMRVDCYEDYVTMMSVRTSYFKICTSAIKAIDNCINEKNKKIEVGESLKEENHEQD